MKWNIITDSSCDLLPATYQNGNVQVSSVPFIISVGNQDFVDNEDLNTTVLLDAMMKCEEASHTSCPSPQSWMDEFEKADLCIAITISSKLSGSMNSAVLAGEIMLERFPHKKIAVLDSLSVGPEITMCVEKIIDLIDSGEEFENIVAAAENFLQDTHISFALSSFDNLVKNGRMSKIAGFIAHKFGMWGIGVGSEEGTIVVQGKTQGSAKAIAMLIEDMKERGFNGGRVEISHCHNIALAEKLQSRIKELWSNAEVTIRSTRGLCSYYAERSGLIMSF